MKRRHHRNLQQPRSRRAGHRLRALLGLVDQQMLEPRYQRHCGAASVTKSACSQRYAP